MESLVSTPPFPIELSVRKPKFNLGHLQKVYWSKGNPIQSHFLNSFSVILPKTEHFFIEVINANRKNILNPKLSQSAKIFCQQEAQHLSVHKKYNAFLIANGYSRLPLFESIFSKIIWALSKCLPQSFLLALTAGGEHVTSFMAHEYLADPERWGATSNHEISKIWAWHAAEEIEHKAVCFDVYQEQVQNWILRLVAYLAITTLSIGYATLIQAYFLSSDGILFNIGTWTHYRHFLLGPKGFLRLYIEETKRYFARDFHPWQIDDRELIRSWQSRSENPGVGD